MAEGYLYILNNAAYPTLLKIGGTARTPEDRVRELSTTGVPSRFAVVWSERVIHWEQVEREVHQALAANRYSSEREFFSISVRQAIDVASRIAERYPIVAASVTANSPSERVNPDRSPSEGVNPTRFAPSPQPTDLLALASAHSSNGWRSVNGIWYRT